ncbi:MAG: hypothetical protein ACYS8W_15610 [Planctomycetota bacterium]|jgi:hypothetical protein
MEHGPKRRRVSRGPHRRRRRGPAVAKRPKPATKEERTYRKHAQLFARKFIDWYKDKFKVELSYDVDSVRALDNLLVLDTAQTLLKDEVVLQMGFFLGEIMRRNFGGDYKYSDEYDALILKNEGISAFPILKIRKALEHLAIPISGVERSAGLEEYMFSFARMLSNKRIEEARREKGKNGRLESPAVDDGDDEDEDEEVEIVEIPLPPDSSG